MSTTASNRGAASKRLDELSGALGRHSTAHRTLLIGVAVLLGARVILSLARSGPVIMADEAGYLTNARLLGGGMEAEMGSSPFYRGGYSLLLTPLHWLDADPVLTYHGVLFVNAVLAACLAPLLYLLLTRCFGASRSAGVWAALAGAAYPSVTALSEVALSENALFPLTVAWLLCIAYLLRSHARADSVGWALLTGACAAALWAVHGRMLVAVGATALLLAALAVRHRLDIRAAGAGLAVLACGMAGARALNDWLIANNYGGRRSDELSTAVAPLDDLGGVLDVLRNLAGQSWYLLVATLGIALVVLVRDAPGAVRRCLRRGAEPADVVLAVLVATTGGLLVVSSLWFATTTRPDQLIYGRYVEPVMPVLIAVGIIMLARQRRPPRLAPLVGAIAALTLVVAGLRATLDVTGEASRWNVASLPSVTGQLGAPVILVAGIVSVAALFLLVLVKRRAPQMVAPVMLLLFVPTTAYIAYLPVLRSERDVYPSGWKSPRPIVEDAGVTTVGYDLDRFDHIAVKVYQWFMPQTRVVLFHGQQDASPTPVFFSGRSLPGKLARRPATALWRDPGRDQVLWRAGPPRRSLSR